MGDIFLSGRNQCHSIGVKKSYFGCTFHLTPKKVFWWWCWVVGGGWKVTLVSVCVHFIQDQRSKWTQSLTITPDIDPINGLMYLSWWLQKGMTIVYRSYVIGHKFINPTNECGMQYPAQYITLVWLFNVIRKKLLTLSMGMGLRLPPLLTHYVVR